MNPHPQQHTSTPVAKEFPTWAMPLADLSFLLKKKKGKKDCCEKYRKGKRCKGCPMRCCA